MKRERVAIIGAGFSGASLAAQLMKRGKRAPDVVLIGRARRFGPGLAYSAEDSAHLLNVRASNMSAFADQSDHFVRWLAKHGRRDAATSFQARKLYGQYLERVLATAHGGFGGPSLQRVRADVEAARRQGDAWAITLSSGRKIAADRVVLALGNARARPPTVFESSGVLLTDPWDRAALAGVPAGDVLLLGAGLTMIDVALSLAKRRKRGVIYALSRRGQVPRGHLADPKPAPPAALDLPLELSDALFMLRKEAEAAAARGEPWQYVIDRLRARTPEFWMRLSAEQQRRFLRHARVWWDVHRHRAAPEIAVQVKALRDEGRLKVLAGEIVSAEPGPRGVRLQHRGRGSLARHNMDVAAVVNCTGAAADIRNATDPLTRQLIEEGIVRAPDNGLGIAIDADSRVISADGVVQSALLALGPITQGAFWESTAVPEIRVRAAAIAAMLAPE
jgi:uncharacterized NAD(P)/FAD-binding protein YdhS